MALVVVLAPGAGDRAVIAGGGSGTPAGAPAPEAGPAEAVADVPQEVGPSLADRPEELPLPPALPVVGPAWVLRGPSPTFNGQAEGITNRPVSGAIHAVVAHPSSAGTLWIGAVNGGIWRTNNATAASPTWTPQTDGFGSLSIAALERDPTDGTHNTLVAGIGRYSSFSRLGGPRLGLLRTTNGGSAWTPLDGGGALTGKGISGVAPRGATIVVAVNIADSFTCANIGIFRSTNTGAGFTMISGAGGTGLPRGEVFDLASDPTNNAVLYASLRSVPTCSPGSVNAIYKSTDTGATWTRVSNAAMEALMANNTAYNNGELAVGQSGEVYAGIMSNGRLAGLFRSGDGGANWVQLDTPSTNEGGTSYGIQPVEHAGAQGTIHFSIRPDPGNANLVYVGGDRQPGNGDPGSGFPNSIGANNYTGRLFRVDASMAPGSQARSLTHCAVVSTACPVVSTSSNSAPHADSREIVFDAGGNLIEVDDGGIYRRTNPQGTGDWFSVNGNLTPTEIHDVAYDAVSDRVVGGHQDNGVSENAAATGTNWTLVSSGDGGDVQIDDISSTTQSRRYSSSQNLGSFRRRIVNASGTVTSTTFPALTVLGGGPAFVPRFVTPVEVNLVDATRILFAGQNDLYESLDRGDTITALGLDLTATAMVFGGSQGGVGNADLIYAINAGNVFVRTAGGGAPVQTATSPGASALRDVVVDPLDWTRAYVVNSVGQVFATDDTGATWTNVTGNLGSGTTDLRTITFVPGAVDYLMVGGLNGVFRMSVGSPGVWEQFGTGLPNAVVWDMEYDAIDDLLVVGTLGRGAWSTQGGAGILQMSIDDVTVTEGNAGTVNAVFTVSLSATSSGSVSVNYATAAGTATAGQDFVSVSGPLTIPAGQISRTISVTVNGDAVVEPNETFFVNLSGASGATIADSQGQGTIANDDAAAMSINDVAVTEGNSGTVSAVFTVSLTTTSSQNISVNYATANGTALAGQDYQAASGTLTIPAGQASGPITVTVNGDTTIEPTETFTVSLSSPVNAAIADGSALGTVTDDERADLLWASDNLAQVWRLNGGTFIGMSGFGGPGAGWRATSYVRSADGSYRLLWTVDNAAQLWRINADNTFAGAQGFGGPGAGWTAASYFRNADGSAQLLWAADNAAQVWTLTAAGTFGGAFGLSGPGAGWRATSYFRAADGSHRVVWTANNLAQVWTITVGLGFGGMTGLSGPLPGWTATSYHLYPDGGWNVVWTSNNLAQIWTITPAGGFGGMMGLTGTGGAWTVQSYFR